MVRRIFLLLIFALSPAALFAIDKPPAKARISSPKDLADEYFKTGDYRNAVLELTKALKSNPKSASLWRNLGSAYAMGQDYDNAILCYERALKRDSRDVKVLYNLSLVHNFKGSPEELKLAQAAAMAGLRENPNHAGLHSSMGNIYADLNRDEDAFREYRRAIELNPKEAVTHFNKGALHFKRHEIAEAEREYGETLALAPHDSEAAQNLAAIYILQERYVEAEKLNRWVIAQRPKSEDTLENAYFNLGLVYDHQFRLERAVNMYKLALQVAPWDAAAYVNTALILEKMDRKDEALTYWQKYQRLFPASRRNSEVAKRVVILKKLVKLQKNPSGEEEP